MELSEEVVDEFMEDVPMSIRLAKFQSRTGKKSDVKKKKLKIILGRCRTGTIEMVEILKRWLERII